MEFTTKILIADENPSQRMQVKDCFLRAGCRYIDEAVKQLQKTSSEGRTQREHFPSLPQKQLCQAVSHERYGYLHLKPTARSLLCRGNRKSIP